MTKPTLTRRAMLRQTAAAGALLLAPRCARTEDPPHRKPNFVFILIDDMGWKDAGFMGSPCYETPRVDRLARQGIVFTSAYTNAPNCAPTRACIMSGQYGPRHGIFTVGTSERGKSRDRKLIPIENNTRLSPDVVTLAESLRRGGYVCGHVGKWHLGDEGETGPLAQGFDHRFGANWGGHARHYFFPPDSGKPQGQYLTDQLTDDAIGFMEANKDRPFFLNLWHHAVHTPHEAIREKIEKYKAKKGTPDYFNPVYAAMIESVDESVGRVLDKLDELKLAEDTVVIFLSDNGGYGPVTSMKPLRGAKGMLYEGGVRVPCIVRWPEKIQAGRVCDAPVIGLDFYPTLLQIAGVAPPDQILDGESLAPLLTTQTGSLKRDALYWHFPAYLEAYHNGVGPWRTTPAGAIRMGDYKLIEFFEDNRLELYNLKEDIGEQNNLARTMPEKTRELHQKLIQWRESVNAPIPTQPNPEYRPPN